MALSPGKRESRQPAADIEPVTSTVCAATELAWKADPRGNMGGRTEHKIPNIVVMNRPAGTLSSHVRGFTTHNVLCCTASHVERVHKRAIAGGRVQVVAEQ